MPISCRISRPGRPTNPIFSSCFQDMLWLPPVSTDHSHVFGGEAGPQPPPSVPAACSGDTLDQHHPPAAAIEVELPELMDIELLLKVSRDIGCLADLRLRTREI